MLVTPIGVRNKSVGSGRVDIRPDDLSAIIYARYAEGASCVWHIESGVSPVVVDESVSVARLVGVSADDLAEIVQPAYARFDCVRDRDLSQRSLSIEEAVRPSGIDIGSDELVAVVDPLQ